MQNILSHLHCWNYTQIMNGCSGGRPNACCKKHHAHAFSRLWASECRAAAVCCCYLLSDLIQPYLVIVIKIGSLCICVQGIRVWKGKDILKFQQLVLQRDYRISQLIARIFRTILLQGVVDVVAQSIPQCRAEATAAQFIYWTTFFYQIFHLQHVNVAHYFAVFVRSLVFVASMTCFSF